ncbi:hypothetical protein GCM10009734_57590 [Nonomuraea bangladeshensis]
MSARDPSRRVSSGSADGFAGATITPTLPRLTTERVRIEVSSGAAGSVRTVPRRPAGRHGCPPYPAQPVRAARFRLGAGFVVRRPWPGRANLVWS